MCTLIVFHEPDLPWPVVVAANRDERLDRASLPFGRHWKDRPWRAGMDVLAGGTWAGLHDRGYGVFVLDQERSLGPAPGKRSRGLLALDLLEAGSPAEAARQLAATDVASYRPFHAVIASASGVIGARAGGARGAAAGGGAGGTDRPSTAPRVEIDAKGRGIWMWTAEGVNRAHAPRQEAHRAAIEALGATWRARADRTADPDWFLDRLQTLMARPAPAGRPPSDALCIRWPDRNFGTRSSIVVAFPATREGATRDPGATRPRVRVAEGPPDASPFRADELEI